MTKSIWFQAIFEVKVKLVLKKLCDWFVICIDHCALFSNLFNFCAYIKTSFVIYLCPEAGFSVLAVI